MDDYYTEMKAATIAAMQEADQLGQTDGVNQRGGKKYLEVKHRTSVFRRHFGTTMGIETSIMHIDDNLVRIKATVRDQAAMIVGSGIAEERRGSSNVNTTSAVENCETSAIGRALASMGLHGGEYASANEIDTAQRNSAAIAATPAPQADVPGVPEFKWLDWVSERSDEIKHYDRESQLHGFLQDYQLQLKQLRAADDSLASQLVDQWQKKQEEFRK
jgi:hypothetical protein